MPKRLPPLNSLRAFEMAARHLSFTKAADALCVTQSAISHQVKALEDFLGVKLFLRRNRALLLTEEGQAYQSDIRAIFAQLRDATDKIVERRAAGALSVSVIPTFAITWLVPRLTEFSELYPDIEVRIKASDAEVDFMREDVEIAIYYGKGQYPGMRTDRLLAEHLFPVCAPKLLSGKKPLSVESDLRHHTLLHDATTRDWAKWLNKADVQGVDLSHGPIFSHSAMVLQAAIYGQGVALAHEVLAKPDLEAGRLVRPFQTSLKSDYAYELVCPESWASRPKIEAFRDWLLETVAKESTES